MSSKRDKLKNAMSKNIFNYEKETFTPVNDLVEALPNLEPVAEEINKKEPIIADETNTNFINTPKDIDTTTPIKENINDTVENNNSSNNNSVIIDESNNSTSTEDVQININKNDTNNINQPPAVYESLAISALETSSLSLFKDGCNNIKDNDALPSIKAYFSSENKNTVPISIRLDKELDVFSKIEAYKNGLNLNMYYNYIIFKDMQLNTQTQNFNPTFDLNNNCLYRKTPAYNSVQKTFLIIPELKEYISIYGAKLGVTPGNYFKYLLRKEYEKSENSCIN